MSGQTKSRSWCKQRPEYVLCVQTVVMEGSCPIFRTLRECLLPPKNSDEVLIHNSYPNVTLVYLSVLKDQGVTSVYSCITRNASELRKPREGKKKF